ncbi:ABC transporter permease [Streptomyces pseudovenezuelae]|uniref:Peptide/nickel transport system permease protein n=1 Tax=Streptomyces pseudovenezuelae TaxID=67350 RepID=A0ABT6LVQ5_9ACTN|nr:ABC transporter permease [Streptomyces pseudovenezuelae]MDH6220398.1 peptide/nickel transport system permease protein [Streptomyces pseudovenezuelae]
MSDTRAAVDAVAAGGAAPLVGAPPVPPARAAGRSVVRALRGRRLARSLPAVLSWLLLTGLVLVALVGPLLVSADPLRQTSSALLSPGAAGHPLGTDDLGRDELARLVHGARPLLLVSFAATALAAGVGTLIGLVAGYVGGIVEQVLMRLVDLALAFPSILLVILLVAAAGPGTVSLVFGIGISLAPGLARLARALTAREAARDYVVAARIGGTGVPRILVRELLPNIGGPLLAQVVMTLSIAAGFAAGLSYLGLGIQPPTPDWGYMVQAGQEFLFSAPRLVVLPAMFTLLFVVACNFVGDDLRDALDPRGTA